MYYRYVSSKAKRAYLVQEHKERLAILRDLPVHAAIIDKLATKKVLDLIVEFADSIPNLDFDGCNCFALALKHKSDHSIILALLRLSLPVRINSHGARQLVSPEHHGYAW
jgi:hypothetical protein